MNIKNKKNTKQGFALILCLIVIMVLATMVTVLINRSVIDGKNAEIFSYGVRAFWLAEAAVQRTLWEYNDGYGSWVGWTTDGLDKTRQWSLGNTGDYEVRVVDYANATPTVIATGYFPSKFSPACITRTINVIIDLAPSMFQNGTFGDKGVTLIGTMYSDSFNSSEGPYDPNNPNSNGDIGTNADIKAGGDIQINGDVATGPDGTFEDPDHTYVTGEVTHDSNLDLPPIPVPPYLVALPTGGDIFSDTTLGPGNYSFNSIKLNTGESLTITGPAELYLTSDKLAIKSTGAIFIDEASTGTVKIYFDNDVDIEGQGIINQTQKASNLLLVGTGTAQKVKIAGQEAMYGTVYAPKSELSLEGESGFFGSYIGETIKCAGGSSVHYDEALGEGDPIIELYEASYWLDGQNSYALQQ